MIKTTIFLIAIFSISVSHAQEINPFYIGHSLVNFNMPKMVQGLADDADITTYNDKQIINGSPLSYNYDNPDLAQGTSYTMAFPDGVYNTLVITEAVPLQNHLTWSNTFLYANNFYNYAKNNNNEIPLRFYVYETWHCTNSGIPQPDLPTGCSFDDSANSNILWQPRLEADFPLWASIVTEVRNQNPTDNEIWMVPAGQAFYNLATEINAGNLTGVTSVTDLFEDDIHPNNAGNYFVACVMFATIYRQSPVGLTSTIPTEWGTPYTNMPTPDQALVMQEVAWNTVTSLSNWTGVTDASLNSLDIEEINEHIAISPNPSTDFITLNTKGRHEIKSVQIYNSMGILMKDIDVVNSIIQTSDLPNGLYYIHSKAKNFPTLTFIKQ